MKNGHNHEFKSSKLLTTFGLLILSTILVSTPINRHLKDSRVESASRQAVVVGYQVAQIYREASKADGEIKASGQRGLASVNTDNFEGLRRIGTMGIDPWGRPYHYRIISADKLSGLKILVWSSGPNMQVDTKDLHEEEAFAPELPSYSGDDMGVIVTVAQN